MHNFYFLFLGLSIIPWILYTFKKLNRGIHMLQQNGYTFVFFNKWLLNNLRIVIPLKEIILIVILGVSQYLIDNTYLEFGVFALIYFILFKTFKKTKAKKPLVYTSRVKRLFVTSTIILIVLFYFSLTQDVKLQYSTFTFYGLLSLIVVLVYAVVYLANLINYPIEKFVQGLYIADAKRKLKRHSRTEVVGITGSFGKTSSKHIVSTILNSKFNTLMSPKSYNTPMGLTITIREYLKPIHEIMVAEMGARYKGDIRKLSKIVRPKYGIVTSIGEAHLETMGSLENIQKEKMSLIESLPSDGIAILNKDDEMMTTYKIQNTCRVLWYAVDDKTAEVYAENIEITDKFTKFEVKFKDEDKLYTFETKLLGRHNVNNILASITLGWALGIKKEQLVKAVKYVKPVEHRLELKPKGDIVFIDDAFNSNPKGAKMAVDVLDKMPGLKVIITPGMIEMGKKQYELNYEFGKQIAAVCDYTILVGPKQTKPIQDGLHSENYPEEKLFVVKSTDEAFNKLHSIKKDKTFVLLENDLPDSFNE